MSTKKSKSTATKRKIDALFDEEGEHTRSKLFNSFDIIESFTKTIHSLDGYKIVQLLNTESIKKHGGEVGDYLFAAYDSNYKIINFRTFHLAKFLEKEHFNYYHKPLAYSFEMKLPLKWCNMAFRLVTLKYDEILSMIIFDLLKKVFGTDAGFGIWTYLE